jgi:RNA polymerase sigma-70 factor (ECF subfamily)
MIYGYVYQRTENKNDAEDITSSSFLRLFEKKKKDLAKMEINHVKALLLVIARNETTDFYRKKKLQQEFLNSHEAAILSMGEEGWHYKDMISECGDVLTKVINELPDRRREILMLKFFEGMTAFEISEKLGISLNTVNNTLSKAYEDIRIKMWERGEKY